MDLPIAATTPHSSGRQASPAEHTPCHLECGLGANEHLRRRSGLLMCQSADGVCRDQIATDSW